MACGIIIIDKPTDWTSQDVAAKLRGVFHERRVGHGGTLDPMATGVLPIFIGRATRAVEFFESAEKEYIAGLRLGVETNTQDTTGETVETHPVTVSQADLSAVLPRFTGEIDQIPPMFSAIKIGGKKLYELARSGKEVERKARRITIREIEILEQISETEYLLRVVCSKGTYIRTLCHDIGAALGCGGCMASLRRTMAAGFTIGEAVMLEDVQERGEALLRPTDDYFRNHESYTLKTPRQEHLCRNGNAVSVKEPLTEGASYRVYSMEGEFLCLSTFNNGVLTSQKNFFGK